MASDRQFLEDDQQARDASLDVSRSFIVQAPAGSGKTELLIQRYLKLLSVVDNPEEIIAITFTRKAAAEMKFRVLSAFEMAHRGEQPAQPHEQLTCALAGEALRRDEARGWQLVANPRRLRIQTLDSLNGMIARLRPISSPESASGVRIIVDSSLQAMYRQSALATLDWLSEGGVVNAAITEVLTHVDNNTWVYTSYLAQMLATRDQWLPFIGSGVLSDEESLSLRRRFEKNLEAAVDDHLQQTSSAMPPGLAAELTTLQTYAASNLREAGDHSNPIRVLEAVTTVPTAESAQIGLWQGLAELLLTKTGAYRRRVDKRQGFPPGDTGQKTAMQSLLVEMADQSLFAELLHTTRSLPPIHYGDEQWNVLLALFRLLPLAVTELKRLFAEQGVSDHIEIALTASAALGTALNPGDVALLLDYQVKHLLVDEMQDTSSAQYRMLEALTGGWEQGDGRSVYCVGDPMQSIYRFRNAEVGQFLLARQYGIGHIKLESLLLRRNFRSVQFLVDWFNTVFPEILADSDDPQNGAVSYSEAVSVPELGGLGNVSVYPIFGSLPEDEAERGSAVIADTLAANPDDTMAVLVRSRTQLPALLAALRKAGIRYQAIEIDRLTDLPEVIEALALTRAAVHQGDRLAWLAVLRAPWIGLDWVDLHALVKNDTSHSIWELLQDEGRRMALSATGRQSIEAALDKLGALVAVRRTQSLRDLVEATWIRLGGPAVLGDESEVANVYRYFDVLDKQEQCGSLIDVAQLESTLDLERVSSDANARLQVMTMHRAKGLEFEHVLLYGLGRLPRSDDRRVLSWFDTPDRQGEEGKVISPVGPRAELSADPVHRFIELREATKNRHEQSRLLYVACTRARRSLHVMGHTTIAADGETCKPPAKRSLLSLLWPALEPQYAEAFRAHTADDSTVAGEPWVRPVLRRFETAWSLPDVAPLPGPSVEGEPKADDKEVEFYWVGTDARIAGTIVHRWLHVIAEGRAEASVHSIAQWQPVTYRWLREMGVGDSMIAAINPRVETALQSILADTKGQWILAGNGRAELRLSGLYDGRIESVVLDRVRIDSDGTHWIIDYKTSIHEGGNLEGFLQAETERYAPQLRKYRAIYNAYARTNARCALYFPLLQTFLEVDTQSPAAP